MLARAACDRAEKADGKPRAVAGSVGPTTKLLSMSPEVGDPGRRDCDFDGMATGYEEQILGLIEGGADILLIETITDTLNAKSALWGAWEAFDKTGVELPLWISGTITDRSGRTLSGQTVEAFYNSVRHANPWAVGLNCALGPADMRAFLADLARVAECAGERVSERRFAQRDGRLRRDAAFDGSALRRMGARGLAQHRRRLLRHDAGSHHAHEARRRRREAARIRRAHDARMKLAGLEPFTAAA